MFRDKAGDKKNTTEILTWILKNQHRNEKTKIYGIWKTTIDDDKFIGNYAKMMKISLVTHYSVHMVPLRQVGLYTQKYNPL